MNCAFVFTHIKNFLVIAMLFIYGCGGADGDLPITAIKKSLNNIPSYSIILEDMKEKGNIFKNYSHKYRVVKPDKANITKWKEVPENYYKANETFLGMSLATKKDGKIISSVAPPGYAYVGDSNYGRWKQDSSGGSFWEFYGKYALLSSLLGSWHSPIYMNDFDDFRRHRKRKVPYFGRHKQYGTYGSIVKKSKPNFYARHTAKQRIKKTSFKNKVASKIGRTKTSFRGRSGSSGK